MNEYKQALLGANIWSLLHPIFSHKLHLDRAFARLLMKGERQKKSYFYISFLKISRLWFELLSSRFVY